MLHKREHFFDVAFSVRWEEHGERRLLNDTPMGVVLRLELLLFKLVQGGIVVPGLIFPVLVVVLFYNNLRWFYTGLFV